MTQNQENINTVAPLRNVVAMVALIDRVMNRSHGLPGMAVFYGPSGFGKTSAGVYSGIKFQAITVQVKSVWTKKSLCEAILSEAGIAPENTISRQVDQISQHLALSGCPLLIDEADYLVKRGMIEIVRDIYEGSGSPVILIGEEVLPQKLRVWERVHGRILDWVAAEPGDLTDVGHLARIHAPDIELSADLRAKLLQASHGSMRRICVNLSRIREHAVIRGLKKVSLADWNGQFFTGVAPEIRKFGEAPSRRVAR